MEPDDKVIVFCSKKSVTDDIASDLMLKGVKCQSIHGDREQYDREQALQDLKTGEVHILIATDVAARGIDIPDITLVFHSFNYLEKCWCSLGQQRMNSFFLNSYLLRRLLFFICSENIWMIKLSIYR